MIPFRKSFSALAAAALVAASTVVFAQQEFPPPQGKGRLKASGFFGGSQFHEACPPSLIPELLCGFPLGEGSAS